MIVSTKTLRIDGIDKEISFLPGQNLLEILNANKIGISQSCDANGSCTTCLVHVKNNSAHLPKRTEIELERANERGFKNSERLACQFNPTENLEIEIQNFSEEG